MPYNAAVCPMFTKMDDRECESEDGLEGNWLATVDYVKLMKQGCF